MLRVLHISWKVQKVWLNNNVERLSGIYVSQKQTGSVGMYGLQMAKALKLRLEVSFKIPRGPKQCPPPTAETHIIIPTGIGKQVCFQHVIKLCPCMCHLCHGWIFCRPICWFLLFVFVFCSGGVSFKMALPILPARHHHWIPKSSLEAPLSLTVSSTHTLVRC